jgi:serine/threonine protein kinase
MADLVGARLGDFELVRELGRGGMGVVYEARQRSLNRRVALKVLSGGLGLTPAAVQRFRREAEAAAKLHHTNIVPVYAIGEEGGAHFYAMELIDGPSLDHVIRQLRRAAPPGATTRTGGVGTGGADGAPPAPLDATGPYVESGPAPAAAPAGLSSSALGSGGAYFDTVARLVAEVADALDYAHREGVVHRDVKPSNLLLSPAGRLSLNDFGLARLLEQPGVTMTGEFVGTPAYMSPEQIAAGRTPLDRRTDVYSLGATLYELLALRPPFAGDRRDQVLAQILHKDPVPPRRVNRRVPVDLETICLKALEKDPDRRYPTAAAMAEDLRRYVNRFAISARRAGPVRRLAKWARRHPAVAASLACVLLAVGAALDFAHRAHRAEEQRRQDQENARAQLLGEKIRNAYLVASTGDLKRTDDAIKEIEALGASAGQVRLLRGVVAYFRQDVEGAVSELEQAAKLLPESIAARALLAAACADLGEEERHGELAREMRRLTPATPEDYLFRGYARGVDEPGEGLDDVDEGIRRGDSPLGRALRAIVRVNKAADTADPRGADAALADADAARAMVPDNALVRYASAYARLMAADIYQEAGDAPRRREVLGQAARDVEALGPFLGRPGPAWVATQYFDDLGEPDRALDVARRSFDQAHGPIAVAYAVGLYRRGRWAEALDSLAGRRQPDLVGDVTRAFVLAERPGGPGRALGECDALARRYRSDVWERRYRGNVLLFLGEKGRAREALRGFRPPFVESRGWEEFYEAMRRFGAGELSEEGYLAAANTSRWKQGFAYYEAGLARLADGDRAAAREHFRRVVRTHTIWLFQWTWSQMFLGRLEADPAWPPWVPAKP